MRHINFFWGPKMGCFGWGPKKFMLKKFMYFFCPLQKIRFPSLGPALRLSASSAGSWVRPLPNHCQLPDACCMWGVTCLSPLARPPCFPSVGGRGYRCWLAWLILMLCGKKNQDLSLSLSPGLLKLQARTTLVGLHPLERDRVVEGPCTRDTPPRWQREVRQGPLGGGGGVAATPLLHTQNCGMSRDRGVATPWSATAGGGV